MTLTNDDDLPDDLFAGLVGMVPVAGSLLSPLAARLSRNVREARERNASTALAAAERVSGLTREELAAAIADDPRLVPLLTRLLYAAGMTGQDEMLKAMGAALGDAVRDRQRINEAELLLMALAELRTHHIDVLRVLLTEPPPPADNPSGKGAWVMNVIAEQAGLREDFTSLCLMGLVNGGLAVPQTLWGATGYAPTDIGRTVLEVLDQLAPQE